MLCADFFIHHYLGVIDHITLNNDRAEERGPNAVTLAILLRVWRYGFWRSATELSRYYCICREQGSWRYESESESNHTTSRRELGGELGDIPRSTFHQMFVRTNFVLSTTVSVSPVRPFYVHVLALAGPG